ncbi:MAG: diacylglycerol/lipid kinase family protein [Chloroflexota bacterium]
MVAVVNPVAGAGKASIRWARVESRLAASGMHVDTRTSEYPGHAATLAREAVVGGCTTVVAVGGDGTVHEVVNGIGKESLQTVSLAVIPAGTGMDFARNMGLPRGIEAVTQVLLRGSTRRIDVGLSHLPTETLFVNFAETGLGAAVVAREALFAGGWPGRLSFLLAAIGAAVKEVNMRALVVVDGEPVYEGSMVSIVAANGRYFGGGMKIAPQASMTDGRLDVLILGNLTKGQLLTHFWKIYPGTHVRHPKVLWLRGTSVHIQTDSPFRLDLDGELNGGTPFQLTVLPEALAVMC